MKQPRWKILLSYLVEWHLESAPSPYNPHLYVSLVQGRYQLSTANAVYSFEDLYDNFSRSFDQLDLNGLPSKDTLLLGLGLGSIPLMLERNYGQELRYTAVEIDESVIYLAQKYVLDELKAPITCICGDAWPFVQQTNEQFAYIAMDVFIDDEIPSQFLGSDFLDLLQERLLPGGLLMFNHLARTERDRELAQNYYDRVFSTQFPHPSCLSVGGNYMMINDIHYLRPDLDKDLPGAAR